MGNGQQIELPAPNWSHHSYHTWHCRNYKKKHLKDAFNCELPVWLSLKWFIGIQDVSAVSVLVWELALKSTRFRLAFFWLIRPAPCRPPQMCLKQKPVSSCVCRLCTVSRHWQNLLHRKHKVSKILWYFDSLSLSNPCLQPLSVSSCLLLSSPLKQSKNFLENLLFFVVQWILSTVTNTCGHSVLRNFWLTSMTAWQIRENELDILSPWLLNAVSHHFGSRRVKLWKAQQGSREKMGVWMG